MGRIIYLSNSVVNSAPLQNDTLPIWLETWQMSEIVLGDWQNGDEKWAKLDKGEVCGIKIMFANWLIDNIY